MTAGLPPIVEGLADQVRAWRRARIPLLDLWRMLDEVDPASRAAADRRSRLAEALSQLVDADVITMPSTRSYDRTERPHLPRFVTVNRVQRVEPEGSEVVWHPELSWVPGAQLRPDQLAQLESVNTWIFRERGDLVVPMRERSVEILGDEKALDRLATTNVFGSGRLTMDLLRAHRTVPQLLTRGVGPGDEVLVAENSDTFDSLARVLERRGCRVGLVGWGAGGGFEASVLSLRSLERPVGAIWYFGDIDRAGLRIPANASALAVASGLPPVRPAVNLYDALLRVGTPQRGQTPISEETAHELVGWLPEHHRPAVADLLRTGHRLAQEHIGLQYLLRNDDWVL